MYLQKASRLERWRRRKEADNTMGGGATEYQKSLQMSDWITGSSCMMHLRIFYFDLKVLPLKTYRHNAPGDGDQSLGLYEMFRWYFIGAAQFGRDSSYLGFSKTGPKVAGVTLQNYILPLCCTTSAALRACFYY